MAIYDIDATPATAVSAFESQFSISATGDIRYVSGTDTFHVKWLNTALQHKVWDFTVSGDDNVLLSSPNPSTSEALGTIITLLDHTVDYSVRYNIDDTAAQYFFGGSIEQQDSSAQLERYSGLSVLGSVNNTATTLQILQDNGLVTEFWGDVANGWNQTTATTLLRVLVKTYSAGAEIDNSIVNVKATHWGDTYAIWTTTLGLGESVAAINTFGDSQNDTSEATVNTWGSIATQLEGIDDIDVDGNGNKKFLGTLSYAGIGNADKKSIYERVKSMFAYNTTNTAWGFDGDLWTGRVIDVTLNLGAGGELWVQNEQVTWTGTNAGSGTVMGFEDAGDDTNTRLIIHLETGIAPANSDTLVGATNSATQTANGAATSITTNANWIGQFYGSAWIAAFGVGFESSELEFGDSVTSLDGETPTVPQNVFLTVNAEVGNAADDPHVFLAEKDPVLNAPDINKYLATGGETTGGTTINVPAIDADEPGVGYVAVLHNGDTQYTFYEYTSRTSAVFNIGGTLNGGTLNANISANDPIFIGFLYQSMTGAGTTKTASNSFVFDSGTRDFVGWVRHGDEITPDKPVNISFSSVGSNSLSTTVVLDDQT